MRQEQEHRERQESYCSTEDRLHSKLLNSQLLAYYATCFVGKVPIFSTLVRILVTVMSCPILSPHGPFVGANTH